MEKWPAPRITHESRADIEHRLLENSEAQTVAATPKAVENSDLDTKSSYPVGIVNYEEQDEKLSLFWLKWPPPSPNCPRI